VSISQQNLFSLTSSDTTTPDRCSWRCLHTRHRRPRRTYSCQHPARSLHRSRRRLPLLPRSVRRYRHRRRLQLRLRLPRRLPRPRPRPLRHRHCRRRCRHHRRHRHSSRACRPMAPSRCCGGTGRTALRPSSVPRPHPRKSRRPAVASRTEVPPGFCMAAVR